MYRRITLPILVAIIALTVGTCSPAGTSKTVSPAQIDRIDGFLKQLAAEGDFRGSALISQGDTILLSAGYGMANIEHQAANTPQTVFHIGSVTKQFTAMAMVLLEAEGKIDFDETVCAYLAQCPTGWRDITIHQLLTHTSGLSESWEVYEDKNIPDITYDLEQIVGWLMQAPLDFEPGTRFAYSSAGYLMLGHVIEEVSGERYTDFMRAYIFQPLGMLETGFCLDENDLAVGYSHSHFEAEYINPSLAASAGGLCSTVEDLYRWDRSFYSQSLLPAQRMATVFTPYENTHSLPFVPPYENASYGYGWFVGERFGHRVAGHGGTYSGSRALIEHYPDDEISIIILANLEDSSLRVTTYPSEILFGGG